MTVGKEVEGKSRKEQARGYICEGRSEEDCDGGNRNSGLNKGEM
jgi:hypothetical protein